MSIARKVEYTAAIDWTGVNFKIGDTEVLKVTGHDLRNEGWHDEDDCPECERTHIEVEGGIASLLDPLKHWHDDESGHAGPFRFCDESPCKPMKVAFDEVTE